MQSLNISTDDLPEDVSRVFLSMLKVVQGRSVAHWTNSGVDDADVLVAYSGGNAALIERWGRSGKPMVMVVDERNTWSATPFKLHHPFRVMQLLNVLNEVARSTGTRASPNPAFPPRDDAGPWSAALSFHRSMAGASEHSRYQAHAQSGEAFWIGYGRAHALPETLSRMRAGNLRWTRFEPTNQAPPGSAISFPLSDAGWYLGMAAPAGPAPWLSPHAMYRLSRWPDLARLGGSGAMTMCALLTRRACTVEKLAHDAGRSLDEAGRLLNAASLAGLLVATPQLTMAPTERTHAPGMAQKHGWMRLVNGLRKHLGIDA